LIISFIIAIFSFHLAWQQRSHAVSKPRLQFRLNKQDPISRRWRQGSTRVSLLKDTVLRLNVLKQRGRREIVWKPRGFKILINSGMQSRKGSPLEIAPRQGFTLQEAAINLVSQFPIDVQERIIAKRYRRSRRFQTS